MEPFLAHNPAWPAADDPVRLRDRPHPELAGFRSSLRHDTRRSDRIHGHRRVRTGQPIQLTRPRPGIRDRVPPGDLPGDSVVLADQGLQGVGMIWTRQSIRYLFYGIAIVTSAIMIGPLYWMLATS